MIFLFRILVVFSAFAVLIWGVCLMADALIIEHDARAAQIEAYLFNLAEKEPRP